MIIQGHEIFSPLKLKTHSVVVGSGAGGGVAAYHMASAGLDTVVLEEGGYFQAKDFNQREEDMMPALYRSAGRQMTTDGLIYVWQGSTFGGSTVINTADATPIEAEVLHHWQQKFGLNELTEDNLAASYERVYKTLNVHRLEEKILNRNNKVLLETANRLGYKAGVFNSNRKGCIGSGYCFQGCAYDAKQGTNLTYLPMASDLGARIYTDVRVDRIEPISDNRYRIHASVVERGTRRFRHPVEIDCERIIMAAGTVHTPAILKRSGLDKGLPQLGKNISLQPQIGLSATFPDEDKMTSWRGAPQSIYMSEFDDNHAEHGLGGFRMEGVGGMAGVFAQFSNKIGLDHKRMMEQFPSTHYSALLVPDQPSGSLDWEWAADGSVKPKIQYSLTAEWKQRFKRGFKTAAEFLFEAGAKEINCNSPVFGSITSPDQLSRVDDFPLEPGLVALTSAHVQGSCRIGVNADQGVVDQNLKLHNLDNIYVVDGSVMPTTASTHTMIPIMVMADRAMHKLAQGA
ncbi:GMC family oxidoreductase N-terminal domain-containing protein [Marinobacterium lutimaris]|uniref:Choline dehydrogenase n=1 Tax=Marinobacterium lutimaris TaxID=568106 RepID=A0A1H5VVD2_9GAMM|nr:GMC family oxidoreductase N-terminal domain-containing protein [Marinobacterium lutimaris]SEF91180.1 Choline dehydrogenase [Marinobacterium lutimaris]